MNITVITAFLTKHFEFGRLDVEIFIEVWFWLYRATLMATGNLLWNAKCETWQYQTQFKFKKFFVALENVFSEAGLINCGFSQGFILVYLRAASLSNIYKWLTTGIKWNTCTFFQGNDVEKIENVLNKEFRSLCECFINNKLSIHFEDDKTKKNFFSRIKSSSNLSISYGDYTLKQHNTVEYLGCYLESNLNGESMARRILKKTNTKLNYFWKQSNYLNYLYRRLLCNALIQTHFDYGCT